MSRRRLANGARPPLGGHRGCVGIYADARVFSKAVDSEEDPRIQDVGSWRVSISTRTTKRSSVLFSADFIFASEVVDLPVIPELIAVQWIAVGWAPVPLFLLDFENVSFFVSETEDLRLRMWACDRLRF